MYMQITLTIQIDLTSKGRFGLHGPNEWCVASSVGWIRPTEDLATHMPEPTHTLFALFGLRLHCTWHPFQLGVTRGKRKWGLHAVHPRKAGAGVMYDVCLGLARMGAVCSAGPGLNRVGVVWGVHSGVLHVKLVLHALHAAWGSTLDLGAASGLNDGASWDRSDP